MKISPIDIAHKNFGKKILGFDPEEVQDFLINISESLENIIRENNQFKENLRQKELHLLEYQKRDEVLKETIETANKISRKIEEEAKKESQIIIREAEQRSEIMVRDARDSLKKIYEEIAELKRIKTQFESNLKAMINAHIAMIEQSSYFMPIYEERKVNIKNNDNVNNNNNNNNNTTSTSPEIASSNNLNI